MVARSSAITASRVSRLVVVRSSSEAMLKVYITNHTHATFLRVASDQFPSSSLNTYEKAGHLTTGLVGVIVSVLFPMASR